MAGIWPQTRITLSVTATHIKEEKKNSSLEAIYSVALNPAQPPLTLFKSDG